MILGFACCTVIKLICVRKNVRVFRRVLITFLFVHYRAFALFGGLILIHFPYLKNEAVAYSTSARNRFLA